MKDLTLPILADDVRKLQSIVEGHIGARDSLNQLVHAPAQKDLAGFESASDKQVIDQRGRKAAGLDADKTYDILKDLKIGYWIGRKFTNAPKKADGSMSLVEITGWEDYLQYNFTRLTDGRTWTRTIYKDTYDTGWNDDGWISLVPTNGFTGKLQVKSNDMQSTRLIEVQFDLKCNIKDSSTVTFGELPAGFPPLDAASEPMYFPCRGSLDDNTNVLASVYLTAGNKLAVFRTDGPYPNKALVAVSGYFSYTR